MNLRAAFSWSNALTCTLVLGCIVLAILLSRGASPAVPATPRVPIGRAVALPSDGAQLPDFAAEDELLARKIPVSTLNQSTTLELEIRAIAEAAHCQIVIDWKSLETATIDRKIPYALSWTPNLSPGASMSLQKGLSLVLGSIKPAAFVGYRIENGIIIVSTEDQLAQHTVSIVYDMRDLISAAMTTGESRAAAIDELRHAITDTVARESWVENGGSVASIQQLAGLFVITQLASNHRQILELLASLRSRLLTSSITLPSGLAMAESSEPPPIGGSPDAILHQTVVTFRIPDLNTLETAIRDLSDAAKVRIYVDWNSLEAAGIKRNDDVKNPGRYQDISLAEAIRMILAPNGTLNDFTIGEERGGLVIGMQISTQFYDIRDLTAAFITAARASGDTRTPDTLHSEAIDQIENVILNSPVYAPWRESSGSIGSLGEFMGILAVTQSPAGHVRVAKLLAELRAAGLAPTTQPIAHK